MDLAQLRLPKAFDDDPSGPPLLAALRQHTSALWGGSATRVPTAKWSPQLVDALRSAAKQGHLARGLELAEKRLASEALGLAMVDARSQAQRGLRVSRLIILSRDGSTRFYRQAEALSLSHGPRVLPVLVDVASAQLGEAAQGTPALVRALLVEHKASVTLILQALYP